MSQSLAWGILGTGSTANIFAQGLATSHMGRLVAIGSRSRSLLKLTIFAPMQNECGTLVFGRRECILGVASLRHPVKRWSPHASNAQACVGRLKVWLVFLPYALQSEASLSINVGRIPGGLLNCLQLFPTPA